MKIMHEFHLFYFSILQNMHKFCTYKVPVASIVQIIQNIVTWVFYGLVWPIHFFTPDKVGGLSFSAYVLLTSMTSDICINHLQVVKFFSEYVLRSLTISSLIALFGIIPIINDFMLLILFTLQELLMTFQGAEALAHTWD